MTPRQWLDRMPLIYRLYYGALLAWLATTAMHIPDGYLSPVSCLVMFLLALPFWARGFRRLRLAENARTVPRIALMAAFSFVLMMFNVPLPGGTTGHAVGGALAAIVLGPELATIAISTVLVIQAVFFGDGGILALGANCFNMAVVLPYLSYGVFRLLTRGSAEVSGRQAASAAIAGWIGLTAAALCAGVEFGLQPLLFHTASGQPLYAPYPLSISVPAMVIPHALLASVVEGLATALVIGYLQRTSPVVLTGSRRGISDSSPTSGGLFRRRGLWVALAALVVATPMGLLTPGTAWGEWGARQLTHHGLGIIPQGLSRLSGFWLAPLPGYNLPMLHNATLGYLLSAVLGVFLVTLCAWIGFTLMTAHQKPIQEG